MLILVQRKEISFDQEAAINDDEALASFNLNLNNHHERTFTESLRVMHLEINERTKRSKNTKQESYKLQKLKFGNEERKKQNEMKKIVLRH